MKIERNPAPQPLILLSELKPGDLFCRADDEEVFLLIQDMTYGARFNKGEYPVIRLDSGKLDAFSNDISVYVYEGTLSIKRK